MGKTKQLSLSDAQEYINAIKQTDLRHVEIDKIKELINPLWSGYTLKAPILRPGELFYRGITLGSQENKPEYIKRISYPSPEHVKKTQRANRAGEPRFYCSNQCGTILYEINPIEGEYLVFSRWRLKEALIATNVGYVNSVFNEFNSRRTQEAIWWRGKNADNESDVNLLIHKFFSEEFSKKVSNGEEYKYKISNAIAEGLFGNPQIVGAFPMDIKDPPKERQFGLLLYPSLARLANTDNAVLLPCFVDKYLELQFVEYIRINKISIDKSINYERLDFANSFQPDGKIEWKGRLPHWKGKGDFNLKFIMTENGWIARNEIGEIVEPN